MSSTARQLPRSKASVFLYLIGATLIGFSLFGFIYSFLPTKTNSAEIDLGSKLSTLPNMSMQSGSEETKTVRIIPAAFALQLPQRSPMLDPQLPGNCAVLGIPSEIADGKTNLKLQYTCTGRLIDPRQIKAGWTIEPGRVSRSRDPSNLDIDTSGPAGVLISSGVGAALAAPLAPLLVRRFIWPAKDERCVAWRESIDAEE